MFQSGLRKTGHSFSKQAHWHYIHIVIEEFFNNQFKLLHFSQRDQIVYTITKTLDRVLYQYLFCMMVLR